MFITLSIYSKNLNSLTNFLKFFYKLKTNQVFSLKFFIVQSQKTKNFNFFSVLQSPHVNKKSQEQFEYYTYNKQLKIHVSQLTKFLTILKIIKIKLFFDIKIEVQFLLNNKLFKPILFNKIDYDKFILKFYQIKNYSFLMRKKKRTFLNSLNIRKNKKFQYSNVTGPTSLKLLDIYGEILLQNSYKCLDSSVGRAKD